MEGTIAPEQIIINGQEYSPEDATQLIELGSKYKKMESDLNTSLDKVYPEYTKLTQTKKELESQLAERTAELERLQKAATVKQEVPTDVQAARKAAREIGLADEDYLKEKGYMTREEVDAYFAEKANQQKLIQDTLAQADRLEQEIDGSDGRVPFDKRAVLAYASTYNIADIKDAYEQMNERGNARWKEAQIEKEERPGLTTLKPGGKKEPVRPKITDDNLGQALSEFFGND